MKLKYHKIYNVDLQVCTAESKLAYNYAHNYSDIFLPSFKKAYTGIQKDEIIRESINFIMGVLSDDVKQKYNIDAIFCCLNYGLQDYYQDNAPIYTSYEKIGQIFKSCYL